VPRWRPRALLFCLTLAALGCGGGGDGPATPAPVGEPPPGEDCDASFESTFAAIQSVIFERQGCTADACHGGARSGGLDLRAGASYASLVDVRSSGSALKRILPKEPLESYLFLKVAARTAPALLTDEQIAGSPMPLTGAGLSEDQLEAVRIWIEAGAPERGAVGDNVGRGSARIEDLLGVCLPEASPVEVLPLPAPAPDEGVQLVMPPHPIPAGSEAEICFASYFDFRERIPARFLDESGEFYFANREERREDPNTHHIIVMKPTVPVELIRDPSFGEWTCSTGERDGEPCDPLDLASCGSGLCRSAFTEGPTCIGFGPDEGRPNGGINFDETYLIPDIAVDGFYTKLPTRGLVYWNSHAFNLTTEDTLHHAWRNFYFTDDLQVGMSHFNDFSQISIAAGTPPFTTATYCNVHRFGQGDRLLYLASHTHKRGQHFWVDDPSGRRIYESPFYDDPVFLAFDPPMAFDSPDEAQRTLTYCALYNNGVAADGSPDPATVTRLSKKPERSTCTPVACAAGRIGAPCAGAADHATCDSSPGAGDGVCDACAITAGLTTDDEMFVLLGGVAVDSAP
jgi:hypothetical protein